MPTATSTTPAAPAAAAASRTHQLIEAHLPEGQSLAGLVTEQRQAGKSWHAISVLVAVTTGVGVTSETLRNWYGPKAQPSTDAS